jgi:hypothetical protein
MRRLIVLEYSSLDGVIQAPGHAQEDPAGGFAHGGWTGPFISDAVQLMTTLVEGAATPVGAG